MRYIHRGISEMLKAKNICEMINAFNAKPLNNDNIADFYVDTVAARDCNPTEKMKLLFRNNPTSSRKILFVGHSGSGKSTELNKIALALEDEYIVSQISIDSFVDYASVTYVDILFVILEELIQTIKTYDYKVDENKLKDIYDYWNDECTSIETTEDEAKINVGFESKVSILDLLSLKINAFLQSGYKIRQETKRKIDPSIAQLISLMNNLIFQIKKSIGRKKLLMIIDNLDKLDLKTTTELFVDHSRMITSLDMNIIYTFPIFMLYSRDFMHISPYFDDYFLLSMIKVKKVDGTENDVGKQTLEEIVSKRTDTSLFEDGVLEFAIKKSGGCIRTLMNFIRGAAFEAEIRNEEMSSSEERNAKINMNDIKHVYSDYRSSMERMIRKEHLASLKEIYENNNPIISDDNVVSDLLMTLAVIEYNGKRWYALNPAVEDYLKEINEIE